MKVVALLLAFSIVEAMQPNKLPVCKDFISKMASTNCAEAYEVFKKFSLTDNYYYPLSETSNGRNSKMLLAIQITDSKTKAKTLHAEDLIAKLKHICIPKVEDAIEFEGWRIQKYDKSMKDFFLSHPFSIMESQEKSIQKYFKRLKDLADMIRYVNSEGFVITNLSDGSFLSDFSEAPSAYFIDFGDTVNKGTAIDDRGDFHYWEPSRLNGEEKVWTEKADLYAFGVILFKAFHKKKAPFVGETREEYTKNVNIGDYEIGTFCTPEIAFILARILHKEQKILLSIKELIESLDYLESSKASKLLSKPIKLNNQKPIPQELIDQLNSEFFGIARSFQFTNEVPQEIVKEEQHKFWLSSQGIILISGLTLALLVLIIWAIIFCLHKNPDEQRVDQKLSAGLDITNDAEAPVQNGS